MLRSLCCPSEQNVDINLKGTFLSDTLRDALPADRKTKGTTGSKPTVPRSTSQPGNHQTERQSETLMCLILKAALFVQYNLLKPPFSENVVLLFSLKFPSRFM